MIKPFYVKISGMTDEFRTDFIEELINKLRENPAFSGYLEFASEWGEWGCWGHVGVDSCGDLMFWHCELNYGDNAVEMSAHNALDNVTFKGSEMIKPFYVEIGRMDREDLLQFTDELIEAIKGNPKFSGYIEYDDWNTERSNRLNWRLVGLNSVGNLVFWDEPDRFPAESLFLSPIQAVAHVRGSTKAEEGWSDGFPSFDFIVEGAEDKAVREWLHDNGVKWMSGTSMLKENYLVNSSRLLVSDGEARASKMAGNLPTISLKKAFQWSITHQPKDNSEVLAEIEELQDRLQKLKDSL